MSSRASIANNIRRFRLEMRLSQEQLALRSEVDRTYISGLERGLRNPSVDLLDKLAAVLSVDTVRLFEVSDDELPKPLPRGRHTSGS